MLQEQANIQEVMDARDRAKAQAQQLGAVQHDIQARTVLHWLSAPNMERDQENLRTIRADRPNSGRWIASTDKFRAWYDQDFCSSPLLWLCGIPGAG